jgi:NifB/MoaA-like Fe-S oxidoreductase
MGKQSGFFASVDVSSPTDYVRVVNPAAETGLRSSVSVPVSLRVRKHVADKPVAIVTGSYGATIMRDALHEQKFTDVLILEVENNYFGGNTAVAGLMTFEDIYRVLSEDKGEHIYLLPDVCLNDGVFLDGGSIEDLHREFDVEVLPTSGSSLRDRLESAKREVSHV